MKYAGKICFFYPCRIYKMMPVPGFSKSADDGGVFFNFWNLSMGQFSSIMDSCLDKENKRGRSSFLTESNEK